MNPRIPSRPSTVAEALRGAGYWYPPDAIQAVLDGRTTYHPYDSTLTYDLTEPIRERIQAAIDAVEFKIPTRGIFRETLVVDGKVVVDHVVERPYDEGGARP